MTDALRVKMLSRVGQFQSLLFSIPEFSQFEKFVYPLPSELPYKPCVGPCTCFIQHMRNICTYINHTSVNKIRHHLHSEAAMHSYLIYGTIYLGLIR